MPVACSPWTPDGFNEMVIASGCGLRDGVVVDVEAGHLY
jgi:hypothetical protein